MIEYILVFILAIIAGTITGLIPGVHINLISALIISYATAVSGYFSPLQIGVFIMCMSVTHTFLDSIPSIFLGAPDSDMALGVLPGHRYLLQGHGFGAVHLTIIGSLSGLLLSVLLFPLFVPLVRLIYPIIKDQIAFILIIIVLFMIFKEKKKLVALYLFAFSGALGMIIFEIPNIDNPLFPLLSGLFGVSALVLSLNDNVKIPKQKYDRFRIGIGKILKSSGTATIIGFFTSFLPGLGPAHGAVIGQTLNKESDDKGFLILIGTLNTVNMILSLATFYVWNKARNGSVIALKELIEIDAGSLILLLVFIGSAGILSFFWAQKLTRIFSSLVQRIDYFYLSIAIIGLIISMSFLLSGSIGLLILATSTATGLIAPLTGVSRSHAMGCLMIPVISYFLL